MNDVMASRPLAIMDKAYSTGPQWHSGSSANVFIGWLYNDNQVYQLE